MHHLAVIDPAVQTPEVDCLNALALRSPLPLTYHLPRFLGTASLEARQPSMKGVLILGSASSVHDGIDWQTQLNAWLHPVLHSGIPVMGLCYGHQLIAHLFGARVGFLYPDQHKTVGFREVTLQPNRLWLGQKLRGSLAVSHRETILDCPQGFEVVGSSPEVPMDAIAHVELPIWGFQAHPEATQAFVSRQGITHAQHARDLLQFGSEIIDYFLRFVADRAG